MDILDRLLKTLGLMRIKRAETMFVELAVLHNKGILEYVWNDFRMPAKANHEQETREWASEAWQDAMASNSNKDWYVLEKTYEKA